MRKNRSSILDAVHETARGFHDAGVMNKVTMREFDRLCLPPVEPLQPEEIRQIREKAHVSQAVFAALLNTSLSTVQKWEIGPVICWTSYAHPWRTQSPTSKPTMFQRSAAVSDSATARKTKRIPANTNTRRSDWPVSPYSKQ
jgi:putative transcriptional regulator